MVRKMRQVSTQDGAFIPSHEEGEEHFAFLPTRSIISPILELPHQPLARRSSHVTHREVHEEPESVNPRKPNLLFSKQNFSQCADLQPETGCAYCHRHQ